jgi:hypothetical protein
MSPAAGARLILLNGIMAPSSLMFIATRYILWVLVCDTCLTYVLNSLSCTSYLISFEVVTVSHPAEQVRRKGRTDSARCHNVERYQTRSAARLRRSAIPLNGIMSLFRPNVYHNQLYSVGPRVWFCLTYSLMSFDVVMVSHPTELVRWGIIMMLLKCYLISFHSRSDVSNVEWVATSIPPDV